MPKMTADDMAQRENIVKSMKKNIGDFRKRYGKRAKEVMYATATKMAMKEDTPEWRRKMRKERDAYWTPERLTSHFKEKGYSDEEIKRALEKKKKKVNEACMYRRKKVVKEEVEQLDELSKKTLKSYAKKAASSIVKRNSVGKIDIKRATGIIRASKKLGVSHEPVVRATVSAGQENLHKSRGDAESAAHSAKSKKANLSAFKKSVNKVKEAVELEEAKDKSNTIMSKLKPQSKKMLAKNLSLTDLLFDKSSHKKSANEQVDYVELDMNNLGRDAAARMGEDDGPHTTKLSDVDTPNFTTVVDPATVVNQPSSKGNIEANMKTAARLTGKPFKTIRHKMRYGGEDITLGEENIVEGEMSPEMKSKMKYTPKAATASPNGGVGYQAKYVKGVKFPERHIDPENRQTSTFRRVKKVKESVDQIDERFKKGMPKIKSIIKNLDAAVAKNKAAADKAAVKNDVKKEEVERMDEVLVGGQKKIDANKNGKLDAQDFKMLRSRTSSLEKRFGHLKPGESASLKGDPKKVKKEVEQIDD